MGFSPLTPERLRALGLDVLPPIAMPSDNPLIDAKVELGKLLFFDRRMSGDGLVSCSSCHVAPCRTRQGRRDAGKAGKLQEAQGLLQVREKGNYWSNNYLNTASYAAMGLICGAGNRPGRMVSPGWEVTSAAGWARPPTP